MSKRRHNEDSGLEETPNKRTAAFDDSASNMDVVDAGGEDTGGVGGAQGNSGSGGQIALNDPGNPGYHVKKTIKATGSTWIRCDTGGNSGFTSIQQSTWTKIPWEFVDFWINREEASDLINDFKYWKVDGVQSFKIMNPMARVETINTTAAAQGLPNPLTEVQMYLDTMYDSGVSQQPYPNAGKLSRTEILAIYNSFTNDGVWDGSIKPLPTVKVPSSLWHPNSPNVKKISMQKNKPIAASWRVNSTYWRSTEEFKCHPNSDVDNPAIEGWQRASGPQSLNYIRTDEHYGYIAPARIHRLQKAGLAVNFQTPERVFKAYGPSMLMKRQPWGNIQGAVAPGQLFRTHIRMNSVEVRREGDEQQLDDIIPYGPISDLSVKHMCVDPTPSLFLRANTFVNNETNGVEPGIVRIDFEVEIPIVCRGKRRTGLYGPSQLNINPEPETSLEDGQFPYDHMYPDGNEMIGPAWNLDVWTEPVFIPMTREIANAASNGPDYRFIQM